MQAGSLRSQASQFEVVLGAQASCLQNWQELRQIDRVPRARVPRGVFHELIKPDDRVNKLD